MFEFIKKVLKVSRGALWVWIVVPLIATVIAYFVINPLVPAIGTIIANTVIDPVKHFFKGPEIYTVFSDPNQQDLRRGFEHSWKYDLKIDFSKVRVWMCDKERWTTFPQSLPTKTTS